MSNPIDTPRLAAGLFILKFGANLQSDELEDRYNLTQIGCYPDFVRLVLGHYGQMKSYPLEDSKEYIEPDGKVKEFFRANKSGSTKHEPGIEAVTEHPYIKKFREYRPEDSKGELAIARQKADKLIQKYGHKALSFASRDQLALMYIMPPKDTPKPMEEALETYISKTNKDFQWRKQSKGWFDSFQYLFEPLFKHINVLSAIGRKVADPLAMKIADFGKLGERMYDVYANLPPVKAIKGYIDLIRERRGSDIDINSNHGFLKATFRDLYKNTRTFTNATLKDLIIDLVKLDNIKNFLLLTPTAPNIHDPKFADSLKNVVSYKHVEKQIKPRLEHLNRNLHTVAC